MARGHDYDIYHAQEVSLKTLEIIPSGDYIARCYRADPKKPLDHIQKIAQQFQDSPYIENNYGYAPATETMPAYLINEKYEDVWNILKDEKDPEKCDAKGLTLLKGFINILITLHKHNKEHIDLHRKNIMRKGDILTLIDLDSIQESSRQNALQLDHLSLAIFKYIGAAVMKHCVPTQSYSYTQYSATAILHQKDKLLTLLASDQISFLNNLIETASMTRPPISLDN